MAELDFLQREIDQWYIGYVDSLSAAELEQVVEFESIGGGHGAMSRSDILLHVVNHTTYHRGHAADILYHLGMVPPPPTCRCSCGKSPGPVLGAMADCAKGLARSPR
ncbi:DinB family protein [Pseudogulbenkiania ferrooxidans]|uniref:DinB family protein n=1 Tax=Pseudogulbenkiania ferrooxidans TaxID=549169 RepID=UPI000A304A24|nr:DinB family protein [Pseudogulbenkiania ferrooxidans]